MMPSGAGATNFGMLKTRYDSYQSTTRPTKTAAGKATRPTARPARDDMDRPRPGGVDEAAHFLAVALEPRIELHLHAAGPLQGHLEDAGDATGAGRHHDDAVGEQDRLGNAVGDEEDRFRPLLPYA